MDVDRFWHLIDATRGRENRAEELAKLLELQPSDEIVRFRIAYDDILQAANTVDLWGAAHVMNGGCTEDDFYEFRQGLIELGHDVFDAAIASPDGLARLVSPGTKIEGSETLDTAPMLAWTAKTGSDEAAFFTAVDAADDRTDRAAIETGEHWNFNDPVEVLHRLPRIAALMSKANE